MGLLSRLVDKRPPLVVLLPQDAKVQRAVSLMAQCQVGIVVIADQGRPLGVFTGRDFLRRVAAKGLNPTETELRKVMTRAPIAARTSDSRTNFVQRLQRRGCRHLPIIDETGCVVDMLTMRELLNDQLEDSKDQIRALRDYIAPQSDRAQEAQGGQG